MAKKMETETEMSLFEHLDELRKRILIIVAIIVVAAVICFTFVSEVLDFLIAPAGEMDLIYTTPAEAFMAQIRLAFTAGAVLTLPLTFYHVLAFITPALRRAERRTIIPLIIFMNMLFFMGMAFSYYVVFPFALRFFMGFETEVLFPLFTISRYISFVVMFLVSFGAVFQVPVVFWFLGRLGIVSSHFLRTKRKFAILIMAVISSLITPPDFFSQLLMIGPLLILYEIGVFLVRLTERRRRKMEEQAMEEQTREDS